MLRVCLLFVPAVLFAASASAAVLRASAVKIDITPQSSQWLMGYNARKSTGILDRIFHRIAVLDDGASRFVLVSSELCLFSPTVYDEVAQDLERRSGIDRKNFWWTVTHTHSAPEVGPPSVYKALLGRSDHEWDRDYTQMVEQSLIDGVRQALDTLKPARLAVGVGASMANINRRAKDVNGAVSIGLNPDGPADRQIGLLRLDSSDGKPIALIANYAMHGTVMSGANLLISGDAPGIVAAYVEQAIGAPMLYINGATGDMAPIYSVYPDPRSGHLGHFRVLLGDRILEANRKLSSGTAEVKIRTAESIIYTPRRAGLVWPEELARYSKPDTPNVGLPVSFLVINDLLIWAAPVELFCEMSMQIRSGSPFRHTFYFGYANGWLGYLPTKQAYAEGGYEPKTSVFTEQAESDLTRGVLAAIRELHQH